MNWKLSVVFLALTVVSCGNFQKGWEIERTRKTEDTIAQNAGLKNLDERCRTFALPTNFAPVMKDVFDKTDYRIVSNIYESDADFESVKTHYRNLLEKDGFQITLDASGADSAEKYTYFEKNGFEVGVYQSGKRFNIHCKENKR